MRSFRRLTTLSDTLSVERRARAVPVISEADAAPKPLPVGPAMLLVFFLALGVWAVIGALIAAMSQ